MVNMVDRQQTYIHSSDCMFTTYSNINSMGAKLFVVKVALYIKSRHVGYSNESHFYVNDLLNCDSSFTLYQIAQYTSFLSL